MVVFGAERNIWIPLTERVVCLNNEGAFHYVNKSIADLDGGAGTFRSPWTPRKDSPTSSYNPYVSPSNQCEYWNGTGSIFEPFNTGDALAIECRDNYVLLDEVFNEGEVNV
jgi:hypothetical protein